MNKIKCIIVNITLVIITSCSTAPSAQGTTSQSQEQQQNGVVTEQSTEEAIHEKTQENSPFSSGHPYSDERIAEALSTMHPQLTDIYIGDDGLFQIVAPDSEYFNDSWYKGYAGMFTQEDLNGKTIAGYEVNPPMQIFGSWSADGQEYFERTESERYNGLMPRSTLYKSDLRPQLMGISRFTEQTPYRELDTEYREMITGDDSLTVDQQLELIIKNHMGYIRNMEIGDLAMQNATELTREQAEELFYDFYGEDKFSSSPFTYYVGNPVDEVRSFERVFRYDDNIFISYDGELVDDSVGEEFVEQIVSSFEILKHRLPLIYDDILAPGDDEYLRINLIESRSNAGATSYYAHGKGRIIFPPTYLIWSDSYNAEDTNEVNLSLLLHELIHNSIKSGQMRNFSYADNEYLDIIQTFEEDGGKSEILTCSSQTYLDEILNMSCKGGSLNAISVWYGVYNNGDIWNNLNPMDYYVRIIDNRLGQ